MQRALHHLAEGRPYRTGTVRTRQQKHLALSLYTLYPKEKNYIGETNDPRQDTLSVVCELQINPRPISQDGVKGIKQDIWWLRPTWHRLIGF